MPTEGPSRQHLSRTLFGQSHRLDVMIAIQQSNGLVNLTDLALGLGVTQSALQAPLRDLQEAGLLRLATLREMVTAGLDVEEVRRRKFYRRNDESLAWPWIAQLKAETDERAHRAAQTRSA